MEEEEHKLLYFTTSIPKNIGPIEKGGIEPDTIWFQKYRLIRELGRGSSATIFLVEHIKLQVYRAVKRISKRHPQYRRLVCEAGILKNLRHPNIPIVYDIEEDIQFAYIIEEYMQGQSLKSYRASHEGIFKKQELINIALQISRLIQFLHSQKSPILYLDLKPENIILIDNVVKLIDFGAAICLDTEHNGHSYSFGTKGYAAPEQYTAGSANEKSDIFGIGMVLHYLMTGQDYICGQKWNIKRYPRGMRKLFAACLREMPEERPEADQLIKILEKSRKKIVNKIFFCSSTHLNRTIGVLGTYSGVGTTYLSVLIASYLSKRENRTVILSEQDGHCAGVPYLSDNREEDVRGRSYRIHGITYHPDSGKGSSKWLKNQDAEYCVIDIGSTGKEGAEELMHCDIKIVILSSLEWKVPCMDDFWKISDKIPGSAEWIRIFTPSKGKKMNGTGNCQYFQFPFEPDPWNPSRKAKKILADILSKE